MKLDKFKKIIFTSGILILLALFVLFSIEFSLSLLPQSESISNNTRYINLRENPPATIKYLYRPDSMEQKNVRFEVDKDGYVFPSKIHENADITILFLGGSTTECALVEEKNRFPYLVGRLLETENKKINSINSGRAGNNSMHSLNILLNKGIAMNPDIAVLMHNINDLNLLLHEGTYWNNNSEYQILVNDNIIDIRSLIRYAIPNLYKRLSFLKNKYLPHDSFAHVRGKKISISEINPIAKFKKNLVLFINICKSCGITPVLMTQANRITNDQHNGENREKIEKIEKKIGISNFEYIDIYKKMNQAIVEVAHSNNVLVINLAEKIPQTDSYLYDLVHLNDNGSKYAAKLIATEIATLLLNTNTK